MRAARFSLTDTRWIDVALLEPDVALTDYGLALECAAFVVLLYRGAARNPALRNWFVLFFGAVGVAALAGGTAHGFIAEKQSTVHILLWQTIVVTIGLAALSAWAIGAHLLFPPRIIRRVVFTAVSLFVVYLGVARFVAQKFIVVIAYYLPATVFLFFALLVLYRRKPAAHLRAGLFGIALTFIAAGVQQAKFGLHPYFNHNALYHALQALALYLIYLTTRSLVMIPRD